MTRKPKNITLIYGQHAVLAALQNRRRECRQLWITSKLSPELKSACKHHPHLKIHQTNRKTIEEMAGADVTHQGIVLETSKLRDIHLEDLLADLKETALVVILDQVTDPHNVGAILRSAAAFGANAVVQQEANAPSSDNPTLLKAASGAVEHVPLITVTNLARAMKMLKEHNFWCFGLDETGEKSLDAHNLTGRVALVLGREGKGLRRLTQENCDILTKIYTCPTFPTLNVSNAAAVALYEARRQNT